ncbi:50S ribosomal protein L21e [Candidatus Micrarchaeota archaeon CG08_land_8_20_14_0_20_59_11]|nr:MAG: 50S ribosomal protein L21e [Candidatus Micrarchaeota archaeon CG08_land_8_20_14_0_20_59_11]
MKRTHGSYSKHSRNMRGKGLAAITNRLTVFEKGEFARIRANPKTRKGSPNNLRFNGKTCRVEARQGRAYKVMVLDGKKEKTLVISNEHMERI